MGRPKLNVEQTVIRFREEGTLARIDAALAEGETRAEFFQAAVEAELRRRARRVARG